MTRILGCIEGTTRVAELRTGIRVDWSPQVTPDCASAVLPVEHFTFTPSLAEYVKAASLVISHAGGQQE